MALRFTNADLGPVLAEAAARGGEVVLAKDQGVYMFARNGAFTADGKRRQNIAYAVGCNPDVDEFDDWWALARAELGGDDFGETFTPNEPITNQVIGGTHDLLLRVTGNSLELETVPAQ